MHADPQKPRPFVNPSKHISCVGSSCFHQLCQLRRIRRSRDKESAATLVHVFVTSRVDYCNAVFAAAPKTTTDKLQRMLNAAARLISDIRKYDQGLSRLMHQDFLWLDIPERVSYKLYLLTHRCLPGKAPVYLSEYCTPASIPSCCTTAPAFSHSSPAGGSATSAQHVRPSGIRCRWPDDPQRSAR